MASTTLLSVPDYAETTWRPDREYVDGELLERNVGRVDHAHSLATIAAFLALPHTGYLRSPLGACVTSPP